jgi:hypothetical protein
MWKLYPIYLPPVGGEPQMAMNGRGIAVYCIQIDSGRATVCWEVRVSRGIWAGNV